MRRQNLINTGVGPIIRRFGLIQKGNVGLYLQFYAIRIEGAAGELSEMSSGFAWMSAVYDEVKSNCPDQPGASCRHLMESVARIKSQNLKSESERN